MAGRKKTCKRLHVQSRTWGCDPVLCWEEHILRTSFIKIFNFQRAPKMLFKENVSMRSSSLRRACADAAVRLDEMHSGAILHHVAAINDHEWHNLCYCNKILVVTGNQMENSEFPEHARTLRLLQSLTSLCSIYCLNGRLLKSIFITFMYLPPI